eukprot:TRINITY_DN4340_c1_g1_i4.p1 TRINITY_DN4340_c1_g1~~TRINITY_DN4340_c1_g1_i4.p1  ORF type:complete len:343 (+),score=66.77 TRINITY_DN4340_c1_g1_i4:70-1029(+)
MILSRLRTLTSITTRGRVGNSLVCMPSRRFHSKHNRNGNDEDIPWFKSVEKIKEKENKKIDFLSSGSLIVDCMLGGGFPKNEITMISGQDHHVKTLFTMNLIRNTQKKSDDAVCAIVDCSPTPFSFPFDFGNKINKSQVLVSKETDPVKAFHIANELCNKVQVIVVDIPIPVPRCDFEKSLGNIEKSLIGSNCVFLYLHPYSVQRNNATAFFNEGILRDQRGLHLEVEYIDDIREDNNKNIYNSNKNNNASQIIGNKLAVEVLKNFNFPLPKKPVTLDMLFSSGITRELEIKNLATLLNVKPTTSQTELLKLLKDYLFK